MMIRLMLSATFVALLEFSTAATAAPQCAYDWAPDPSYSRVARSQKNSVDRGRSEEVCRGYIKQFIEAVNARQAASTCQDSIERQRALLALDAMIQKFNDRIAEQACDQ